jgi:hypothetical protein
MYAEQPTIHITFRQKFPNSISSILYELRLSLFRIHSHLYTWYLYVFTTLCFVLKSKYSEFKIKQIEINTPILPKTIYYIRRVTIQFV